MHQSEPRPLFEVPLAWSSPHQWVRRPCPDSLPRIHRRRAPGQSRRRQQPCPHGEPSDAAHGPSLRATPRPPTTVGPIATHGHALPDMLYIQLLVGSSHIRISRTPTSSPVFCALQLPPFPASVPPPLFLRQYLPLRNLASHLHPLPSRCQRPCGHELPPCRRLIRLITSSKNSYCTEANNHARARR